MQGLLRSKALMSGYGGDADRVMVNKTGNQRQAWLDRQGGFQMETEERIRNGSVKIWFHLIMAALKTV
jgi:antibiotic biosynthesis monooxygenase (ABM) superfamily enzyme